MSKLILEKLSCARGAPMGRRSELPDDINRVIDLHVEALKMCGDYDQGGAYWGYTPGTKIYCGWNDDGVRLFTRAASREEAKKYFLSVMPGARFYK